MIDHTCGYCGAEVQSADRLAGQADRCPKCDRQLSVPHRAVPAVASPLDALASAAGSRPGSRQRARANQEVHEPTAGFFAPEKRGIQKGVIGGVAMMVIAAVWFGVGWHMGVIFYYPPILFAIGLYAFFKGLFTGNISGR